MAGGEHFFAIHEKGLVYALGLDHFAQTGSMEQERYDFVNMLRPCPLECLNGRAKVNCIGGGNYRSVAVTGKGECIT